MTRMVIRAILAAMVLSTFAVWPAMAAPARWRPNVNATWQIQFSGRLGASVNADVFDLDLFDTTSSAVTDLHAAGRRVVCYINAGAWEKWRPDAGRYPRSVKGEQLDGWPGERWLDIRRLGALGPILEDRLDLCRAKGFDGVEFDNVNGYTNPTGFNLHRADQLAFNRWLAAEAHERGIAVGLKNTLELAEELEPVFDFAILEQCFVYHECTLAAPFIDAGKAVLDVEYDLARRRFCSRAVDLGLTAMRKHLELDAWRAPC